MKDDRVHPPEIGNVTRLQVDGEMFQVRKPIMDIIMSALWASGHLARSFVESSTKHYRAVQIANVDINIKSMVKALCLLEKELASIAEEQANFMAKMRAKLALMNGEEHEDVDH